ncbi:MAG TPA: RHS repeat-associated core domain-containing protein [Puia sp.]|nr:RHS repeat-associated core domain-containing protein [Puia sp.]
MKRHNLIGYILSLVLLLPATTRLFAGTGKPMLQVLDGSLNQLSKDSFNIVQDSLFFDPTYNGKLVKPYLTLNRVTFRINEVSNVYLQSAFSATVRLHIAMTQSDGTITTTDTSLIINYRADSIYTNRSSYAFRNAYKVQITVLSVSTNVSWNVWQALEVENEIRPFPLFNFSCTSDAVQSVSAASLPASTGSDELPVSWGNVASADVYDVEWMYADSTALAAGTYGSPGSPSATLLFDNNASRVTVSGTSYNIPLFYDGSGTLFFRVRSVQLLASGGRAESHWSSDFGGGLGSFIFNGHERSLNWQATTRYEEDGKRNTVVEYYDGTFRKRQIVSRNNSTDTILVQESYYDYQGRSVINVMPSPGLSSVIAYAQNFNVGLNGNAYDKNNFDSLADPSSYCSAPADAMSTDSGAARYYSANNPSKTIGYNQYIPDAGGYPFTQTEYTPDNTNRVSRQGGVGPLYQLGGGHETKTTYGTPDQKELDALFGTEVGDHSHYYKAMRRDANGQYHLTYTDMHGRTIATALAGAPPDSIKLDKLASNIAVPVTETLSDQGSTVIKDLVMESKRGLLVPMATTDTFTYILNPASLTKNDCNNTPVCYDCLYDLEITITDDCNNQKLGGQPFDTVVHNFSLGAIDTTCNPAAGFQFTFTKFLQEGSYEVTKKLSVSRAGMNYYRDSIFRKRNTCQTATTMINTQKLLQAAIIQCQPTCQSCRDSLGDWSTFQQRFMQRSGIPPSDSANYQDQAYQAYLQAQADCNTLCGTVSEFDDTRNAMLLDLTPPSGQYANPDSSNDIYSIFYTKYNGSTVVTPPDYTQATGYLNGDGQLDSVYDEATGNTVLPEDLSPTAFTQKFKLSWAEALLPYHPEYCKLVRYESLQNSSLWDTRFGGVDTYAEALAKGYLNPTGNGGSPFNKYNGTSGQIDPDPIDTCGWFNFKSQLEAQLQAYTATGSNATSNHPTSMWAYASAMVTCGQTSSACFNSKANNDSAFNANMCTGDLDMAWRNFRQLYLDTKRKLINDQLKAACSVPSAATLVAAHRTPHFSDGAELLSANGVTLPTSAGDTTTAKNQGAANASGYYIDNCTTYATTWWKQLAGCNFTSADSAIIVPQLIQVCAQGSDGNHPFGASSVAPSSTYRFRDFRDVLQHYSDSTHKPYNNTNACNAYLITDPPPYDRPRPYSDLQVRSTPDSCQCHRITSLYAAYQLNNQGYGSFSAYVNGLNNTSMSESDLQALRTMCTAPSGSNCTYLATPINIPAPLQCGGDQSCITCAQMAQTYSQFLEDNPTAWRVTGTDSATLQTYYTLFTNYFNTRLGYKKNYADYMVFLQQCSIPYLQPVLGANILPGPVVPASNGTGNPATVQCSTLQTLVSQFNTTFPSLGRFNHGTVRRKATFYPSIEYMLTCSSPGSKIVRPTRWVGSGLRNPSDTTNWFRDTMTFVKFDFSRFAGKSTLDSVLMKMSPVLTKPFDTLVFWCNMGTLWDTTLSCGQLSQSFTSNTLSVKPPGYQYFTSKGHLMYAYTQTTALSRFIASSTTNIGHILTSFLNTTIQSHNSATFLGSTDSVAMADPEAKPHMDVYYRMDTIFQCKDLVAAWFNAQLNTSLSYDSLASLYHSVCGGTFPIGCTPYLDTLKLCGRGEAVFPTVTLPQINSCSDSTFFSVSKGTELYNVYSDSLNNDFDSSYRTLCMQAYKFESFTVTHSANTYHYNLFYYDQAGNLLKTVSPEGVHPVTRSSWLDSVQVARNAGQVLIPAHTLITQYRYNSLDMAVASMTPDASITRTWYDGLARKAVVQTSRQRTISATENGRQYTYTIYDFLGRVVEVGQITNATTTPMTDSICKDPTLLSAWLNNSVGGKSQITQSVYDLPYTGFTGTPIVQRNLRNRVSYASYTSGNNPAQFDQASFFTYDILGNIDTILQDYGSSLLAVSQNVMNLNGSRWKKMSYQFDLASGKTNSVAYQAGQADQIYYRYTYDADNRLTLSESSTDSIIWEKDERIQYYLHGPQARSVFGDQLVQGIDYAYTLQGWLKGVNSTALNATIDMGGDGKIGGVNQYVARDAVSFSLNYFSTDYTPINSSVLPFPGYSAYLNTSYKPLYNGNISSSTVNIAAFNQPLFYNYTYDQLNRLTAMDAYGGLNQSTNSWAAMTLMQDYKERAAYDESGNILRYLRNGFGSNLTMDSLSYNYNRDAQGHLVNNLLNYVRDRVNNSTSHSGNYTTDVDDQSANNYTYDSSGELKSDAGAGITAITWNAYGKITEVQRNATGANPVTDIQYGYDASGNRMSKRVQLNTGAITYTWYVRDMSGNVMAIYTAKGSGTTYSGYSLTLTEQDMYGSKRLGDISRNIDMKATYTSGGIITTQRGARNYELANHLGNVLTTITDKKLGVSGNGTTVDYYTADVTSANDYYPFGMQQPGRGLQPAGYRYGFNGKENDNEVNGPGNWQDYGMRMYNPQIGRFMREDPLTSKYPYLTPYQFASNSPISGVDRDGLEWAYYDKDNKQVDITPTTTMEDKMRIVGVKWVGYDVDAKGNKTPKKGSVPVAYTFGKEGMTTSDVDAQGRPEQCWQSYSSMSTGSAHNDELIGTLHESMRSAAKEFILKAKYRLGMDTKIDFTYRSWQVQDEFFSRGRTQAQMDEKLNRYHITRCLSFDAQPNKTQNTKAPGWWSPHQYGLAMDIYPAVKGNFSYDGRKQAFLGAIGEFCGLHWGISFGDPPHFEDLHGRSWTGKLINFPLDENNLIVFPEDSSAAKAAGHTLHYVDKHK